MPTLVSPGSTLGASISTGEIDDAAVTRAKVAAGLGDFVWLTRGGALLAAEGTDSLAQGATDFYTIIGGAAANLRDTTEANLEYTSPVALSVQSVYLHFTANTLSVDATFTFRKNGADSGSSVTLGAGNTGFVEIVGPFSIAAGDRFCVKAAVGAGTGAATLKNIATRGRYA